MTLDEFMNEQVARLSRFGTHWVEEHRKNPENYPAEMDEGEWGEQFLAFED